MKNLLFILTSALIMLTGCANQQSAVGSAIPAAVNSPLEKVTIEDAKTASTMAKSNNRLQAAACYDAIATGLEKAAKPTTECGLLCHNEVLAALNIAYRSAQAVCAGVVVLP